MVSASTSYSNSGITLDTEHLYSIVDQAIALSTTTLVYVIVADLTSIAYLTAPHCGYNSNHSRMRSLLLYTSWKD